MKLLLTSSTMNLLRRLPVGRQAAAASLTTRTAGTTAAPRSYSSSLHEAAYSSSAAVPLDYDASLYGYRVVVNSNQYQQPARHSSTMSSRVNDDDDYNEFGAFHNAPILAPTDNLDILASPEVQEILESQRDWDKSLRSETMVVQDLKDSILDGYHSDCEEMTETDQEWEQCSTTAATVEVNASVTEDTADAVLGDAGGDSQ